MKRLIKAIIISLMIIITLAVIAYIGCYYQDLLVYIFVFIMVTTALCEFIFLIYNILKEEM